MSKVFAKLTSTTLCLFLLSSCAVTDAYWDNLKHTSSLRHFVSDEAKLERYAEKCRAIGFTSNGERWQECLLTAAEMDSRDAAARAASSSARSAACGSSYSNC
jgi:hypothetical protein